MRHYQDIIVDVNQAITMSDSGALERLSAELAEIGTEVALAESDLVLGNCYKLRGKLNQALASYELARKQFQDLGNNDRLKAVLGNMGIVYTTLGDNVAAMLCFEQELSLIDVATNPGLYADTLIGIGNLHIRKGSYADAMSSYKQAYELYLEDDDVLRSAIALGNMADVHYETGDPALAIAEYERALAIHIDARDRAGEARVLGNLGGAFIALSEYAHALPRLNRALDLYHELEDPTGVAFATESLALLMESTGQYPEASERFYQAISIHRDVGDIESVARLERCLGSLYLTLGDHQRSRDHFNTSRSLYLDLDHRPGLASVEGHLGLLAAETGELELALDILRSSESLHRDLGNLLAADMISIRIADVLCRSERLDECEAVLQQVQPSSLETLDVRSSYLGVMAEIEIRRGKLDVAQEHLTTSLDLNAAAGRKAEASNIHRKLRDLAQLRNDFSAYIHHNNEFNALNEELHGKEATKKLTMMDAERQVEAERREREKERALLYGALPKSVADRMIRGEDTSSDHFEHAVVLFIDIVGFTENSARISPAAVVTLLKSVFSTIDDLCDRHHVIKVKTIGDSYMCFRGDASALENARSVASVAMDVMAAPFTWPDGSPITFRAGIHIGDATAGVIGTQRLQYDIWGDTVNMASRLESTCEPGKIQVSEAVASALSQGQPSQGQQDPGQLGQDQGEVTHDTWHLAHGTWHLALRGEIELKGKGTVTTYWLTV